jgi:hypothetical protein
VPALGLLHTSLAGVRANAQVRAFSNRVHSYIHSTSRWKAFHISPSFSASCSVVQQNKGKDGSKTALWTNAASVTIECN